MTDKIETGTNHPSTMTPQQRYNKEFQLQFCTTNLRYLAGEQQTPEILAKIQYMEQEIARLEAELD